MTVVTRTSYLEVNSIPLSTPAYWITDLDPVMRGMTLKGGDIDVPHAHGGLGNPRRRGIDVKLFELVVCGFVNKDGTAQSNLKTGLEANLDYLESNLGIASTSGDGSVPAIWHRWDAGTRSANVIISHWEAEDFGRGKRQIAVAMELTVLAGRFA